MRTRRVRSAARLVLLAAICCFTHRAASAADAAARPDDRDPNLNAKIDQSLAAAARFLAGRQDEDGAWRSRTYGFFRDGPSLTPHVLSALFFLPEGGPEARRSFSRGVEYLMKLDPRDALAFPVYTSAAASWVVALDHPSRQQEHATKEQLAAQQAWLARLRGEQLNERLGWTRWDMAFGGWGYSVETPRRPAPNAPRPPLCESNLSATIYGLGALRAARVPVSDPVYQDVLLFVSRCQNFAEAPVESDERFDDGGFFFNPDDAAKNKAGVVGTDRSGRIRFHSYGSTTADGLRGLLHCGLAPDHPRVLAARAWLEKNFAADRNPGTFEPDREVIRRSTYFYYCWSVAHALMHLGPTEIETNNGKVQWPSALAAELLKRQHEDGSWTNEFTDTKEDDPLVATPHAAAALAICRRMAAK